MNDHRDSVTLSHVKSDENYYVPLFSYTDVTQFKNSMVILPGSKSLWEATFHDVVEAVRLQLGFDYYFSSVSAAVAVLFFAPITILGNLIVISAFCKDPNKNLRSPSYILLTSLALSDFAVGAVQTPLTAYYWLDSFMAKRFPFPFTILLSVNGFVGLVSILHLLALSVDRFLATVTPLKYPTTVTKNRVYITVACIWGYSIVVGCIAAVLEKIISGGTLFAVHIVILCSCITYLNTRIVIEIRRTSRELNSYVINEQANVFEKRERKVVKLVFLVLSVFVICYLPWCVTLILVLSCSACNLKALMYVYAVSGILLYVSPLIHPFLYTWRLPKFKEALLRHFKSNSSSSSLSVNRLENSYNLNNRAENATDITNIGSQPMKCRLQRSAPS